MLRQVHNLAIKKDNGPVNSGPFLYPSLTKQSLQTCWIEIDKKQFFSNAYWLKKLIGPHISIAAVLKSNAYGHGLCEAGLLCQEHEAINYITVFLLSDAIKLRTIGVKKPIVILGGYDRSVLEGMQNGIDLVIYDWQIAQEVYSQALLFKNTVRIQLKVDTGLARLGFAPEEILSVVKYFSRNLFIVITGIYSHFAESDSMDTTFTFQQIGHMNSVCKQLKEHGFTIPYIHMANTAAALRFPEARGTMIRCGGALYGSYKDERFYQQAQQVVPGFSLKTCFQLKTRIITIREVPIGVPIGYGRSFKTTRPTRLAIVAVGYYDGYDRRLSNKGKMFIHGKIVPIIGRVGMNMTPVDITDIPEAKIGDEVVVIGNYEGLRLKDIAQHMNVIEYEVMPPLNPALSRFVV